MQEIQREKYANYLEINAMPNRIPFVDLHAQYLSIKGEVDKAISDVIVNSSFVRGKYVQKFEEEFASELGVEHCISCANGTDSLYIAMRALDVMPGDEVIAPAHSWISTTETITQAGGKVVFCDTKTDDYTIDPIDIRRKITSRTVGIIPVHLYGQPADMGEIMQIADEHNLWVLEDCAQAHMAKYKGQYVGTFGNVASFSFYPGKNLGAMGDAGALVTNDSELKNKMSKFARHGGLVKGEHEIEGVNSRMDGLQAAILSVKLKKLHQWTESRREIADLYTKMLSDINQITLPKKMPDREHVWHLYVIKTEERDNLRKYMGNANIETIVNYPVALPFLKAYQRFNHIPEDFPNAYKNQSRVLSLPIYPEIKRDAVKKISNIIAKFYNK